MRRIPFGLGLLLALALVFSVTCKKEEDPAAEMSQATIAFTDAAADELALFEVDVTSVIFHKYSGAAVSVLTKKTRVDFASLEDFAEVIVGVGLEAGYYTGMTLTLDFANALVYLKDVTPPAPATVLDDQGNPLTGPVEVRVDFPPGDRPYVTNARNHLFMLDLDLNQAIETDSVNNQVTFTPIVTAEVDPSNPKPILATGYLFTVNTADSLFVVEKRTALGEPIARFKVLTDVNTIFHVDGAPSQGATGLAALAGLAADTRVWIQGTVDPTEVLLKANIVEAGNGTFGSGQDWVEGLVTGRSAAGSPATLTVLGTSKRVSTGMRSFNTSHTVDVSSASVVLFRGSDTALSTDEINVGQRILAFGTLDAGGTVLTADTSAGVVRLIRSDVYGTVQTLGASTMTITAARFGLRPVSAFNFTVGGTAEANPASYTVDTTGIDTSNLLPGDRVRAIGRVNAVAVPADENFAAISVVKLADILACKWITPSDTVLAADHTEISLTTTGTLFAVVDQGHLGQLPLGNPQSIRPLNATGLGVYLIFENGGVQLHWGYAGFSDALNARISPASKVASVAARGRYDPGTGIFHASAISVVLKP